MSSLPHISIPLLNDNFDDTTKQWFEDGNNSSDSDIGSDNGIVEISDHDTDSTIDGDSSNNENECEVIIEKIPPTSNIKYYFGKNKFKWSSDPEVSSRNNPKLNIVFEAPGLKKPLNQLSSLSSEKIWSYLVDDVMLREILLWTNVKIRKENQREEKNVKVQARELDLVELKAFIGLLFYTAAFKSHDENIDSIFATDGTGREIFRTVMSKNRFVYLLKVLRFDNPETRKKREQEDPAAAVSFLFNRFVDNCQKVYTIGPCATMDEMLIGFRGRCKFKMYIPGKRAKCGLKIMALTDARNHYFLNGYIYTGKNSDGMGLSRAEQALDNPTQCALRLTKPIHNSNRNVTADNWFTSIELVDVLKGKGLTYLGSIKKNKKEIPRQFLPDRKRECFSTKYGFSGDISLISYVPKRNKVVLLLSTMHHVTYTDPEMNNPEIICYFNNKAGVDSLDETCRNFSTGRRTRRWSMTILFRILDISTANAHILYNLFSNNPHMTQFNFLKDLAFKLVSPELERRLRNHHLTREVRFSISRILGVKEYKDEGPIEGRKMVKRLTCRTCPSSKKRKTAYGCVMCNNPVCLECSREVCRNCL